jgi:hypothetical protein
MSKKQQRRGYSLAEMVISMSSATVLLAGMGSSIYLANRAFRTENTAVAARTEAAITEQEMLADLQLATGFTERTTKAVTFTVPDRDGDNQPETLRYAWSGISGDPLTFTYNGGATRTLLTDVRSFALNYQTQTLAANPLPAELIGSTILLAVNDSNNPDANELARKNYLEKWNYQVIMMGTNDTATKIADCLGKSQAVYLSSTVEETKFDQAIPYLASTPLGIVTEHSDLVDELGLAGGFTTNSVSTINIANNNHYIATGLNVGNVNLYYSATSNCSLTAPASDLCLVGSVNSGIPSLASLSKNKKTISGSNAPGRRVVLPWEDDTFNPDSLKPEGLLLMKQSVEWATGLGADPILTKKFGQQTVLNNLASNRRVQIATRAQLSENGTLKSISAYVGGAVASVRVAIYSDSAGEPNIRLAQSALANSANAMGWVTIAVPDTALSPGYYWLAMCYDSSNHQHAGASSGITPGVRTKNYDAIPNGFSSAWGTSSHSSTASRSIYATYQSQ